MTVNEEVITLIKMLMEKIEKLEKNVYDGDNILVKSGMVKVSGPVPSISHTADGLPDSNAIAKMSWEDINNMVAQMEGRA